MCVDTSAVVGDILRGGKKRGRSCHGDDAQSRTVSTQQGRCGPADALVFFSTFFLKLDFFPHLMERARAPSLHFLARKRFPAKIIPAAPRSNIASVVPFKKIVASGVNVARRIATTRTFAVRS